MPTSGLWARRRDSKSRSRINPASGEVKIGTRFEEPRKKGTMDRPTLAARILKIDGVLLLVVALIHFAATPFALRFVSSRSTPETFVQIEPPFLLSFIVVGILLVPLGLSTVYSADSFRRGERWARAICGFNALAVFLLPVALVMIMPARYFRAILFLVAATLVWIVAISMTLPLVLRRSGSTH